jgi:son of sevenless
MNDFQSLLKYENLFISQEPSLLLSLESKIKPKISLLDIDPLDLAQQISLISFDCFKRIKVSELHFMRWNHKEKHILSPNITEMIQRMNKINHWIIKCIISEEKLKKRVKIFEYLMRVLIHFHEIGDFNSLNSFYSGLESSPVGRLKITKSFISTQLFDKYEMIDKFSSLNHHQIKRIMEERKPPLIPYLGVSLVELTFIEDGYPKMVKFKRNYNNYFIGQVFQC